MKKIVFGGVALSSILVGASSIIFAGCSGKKIESDPKVERMFQGDWRTEYRIDNENMRMLVSEKISFDTLTHRYKVTQVQKLIFPVSIKYADLSYEGTWKADGEYFQGEIDKSTIKNEVNSKFDEIEEYKTYFDFVEGAADADMQKDDFIIRKINPERIHLFEADREVAHDLIRAVNPNDTVTKTEK